MEDREASDRIEAAFIEALKDQDMGEEGDVLGDWLIIGYVANPSNKTHGYPMLFSNGNIANHSAQGLLHTGLLMLNRGELD